MPNTLYIHLGAHKTGSSYIQRLLSLNNYQLYRHGYIYIDYNFISSFEDFDDCLSQLYHHYGNRDDLTYVVSYEGFCGSIINGYLDVDQMAQKIQHITTNFDVRLILYIRRQDQLVESMYVQEIKTGYSLDFQSFIDALPSGSFDWAHIIKQYEYYFPQHPITIVPFKSASRSSHQDIGHNFLSTIGLSDIPITYPNTFINPSYNHTAVDIQRYANQFLDKTSQHILRRHLTYYYPKDPQTPYCFFSHQERLSFLDSFMASNTMVSNRFFNGTDFFSMASLKDSSTSKYQPLTNEEIFTHVQRIIPKLSTKTYGL